MGEVTPIGPWIAAREGWDEPAPKIADPAIKAAVAANLQVWLTGDACSVGEAEPKQVGEAVQKYLEATKDMTEPQKKEVADRTHVLYKKEGEQS